LQRPKTGVESPERPENIQMQSIDKSVSMENVTSLQKKKKGRKVRKPKRSPLRLNPIDFGEEQNSEGEIINIRAMSSEKYLNAGTQMSKVELHADKSTPMNKKVTKCDKAQSPMSRSSGRRFRKLPKTEMKMYEDLRIFEEARSER